MKLKPCPFCGSEPGVQTTGITNCTSIGCENKDCPALARVGAFTEDLAVEMWNTRVEEHKQSEIEETVAHWNINCDGYYPFCSHCGEAAQHMSRFCPNCGRKMITRRHEDA